ncbi:hypothetical protein BJ508DRAFT_322175 [Ascobolus immersus RN42]|uniref:Uncharacterized protein n=1 Tax=Ascobolus immersus RN42 TaxID=1160509 RepID=A0A3N4IPB7_ASCIM|nr:hypothetical protein BJ508DRAFT_322175 [Ascobolus immersus RN42]
MTTNSLLCSGFEAECMWIGERWEVLMSDRYPKDYDYMEVMRRLNGHFSYVVDVMMGGVGLGRSEASHAVLMSVENQSVRECGRVLLVMERYVEHVWRGVQILTEEGETRGRQWGDEAVELFIELQVGLFCGEEELGGALGRLSVWRGLAEGMVWSLVYAGAYARGGSRVLVVRIPEPPVQVRAVGEEEELDLEGVAEDVWLDEVESVDESVGGGYEDDRRMGSRWRPIEIESQQMGGWEPINLFTQEEE